MHFCQSRKLHLDLELTFDGVKIEVVPEFKFLGLLFDSKLLFIPHINYLSNKCYKALNLLRVVSSIDWGADRKVLVRLYRSLVRSKLDYGCIVYMALHANRAFGSWILSTTRVFDLHLALLGHLL